MLEMSVTPPIDYYFDYYFGHEITNYNAPIFSTRPSDYYDGHGYSTKSMSHFYRKRDE